MANIRLSHSATSCFQECPRKYKYRYKDKLREKTQSAALLFGSAIDGAINTLLEDKKNNKVQNVPYYQSIFAKFWSEAEINKVRTSLPECTRIAYAQSDFDAELLTDKDLIFIEDRKKTLFENQYEDYRALDVYDKFNAIKKASGIESLKENEAKFINLVNWLSLFRKGEIMITSFIIKILPKLKEVKEVQRKIELTNSIGDSVIGFIDFIAVWEDGRTVVFDNKTSSVEYEKDAVKTSPQLSLYVHESFEQHQTRTAGYIVMRKAIKKNRIKTCTICNHVAESRAKTCDKEINNKRCSGEWNEKINPECQIDVLIDDVPEITEDMVLQNFDEILQMIKAEFYPRNFNACVNNYGRCAYWALCYQNSMKNIEKVS